MGTMRLGTRQRTVLDLLRNRPEGVEWETLMERGTERNPESMRRAVEALNRRGLVSCVWTDHLADDEPVSEETARNGGHGRYVFRVRATPVLAWLFCTDVLEDYRLRLAEALSGFKEGEAPDPRKWDEAMALYERALVLRKELRIEELAGVERRRWKRPAPCPTPPRLS
jgi:hypothetical protein